ncbi:retrovirus-related Pol polyprotein from transposon 297 [Trichonephila clavipes]|nr:retrovirus-related Pol polyprotein from transposon 297 [Trichonephila clavipes]
MIRWALKLLEFNIEWEHRPGAQNVVADVLSMNPVDNVDRSQISCAALRALALSSREQLIQEQREDPELGHIYRYLENLDDGSVNATVCEGWSQDFKLIDGLLFYAKYCTTIGELRVYIPQSLREAIMHEFQDPPLAGHLGKKKTYLKIHDTCYFPYMRKFSPTKEESRRGARVQSDKARETRATGSKGHSAAEGRPVRSGKTTTVRPCPYCLRSLFKELEGIPE